MLLNCGAGKDSWESLGLQGDQISPLKGNWSWIFIGRTDAEAETPILWPLIRRLSYLKTPWWWEWLQVGGEGEKRGWDGWMALPTQWTWVWVSSGSRWWTGKPGMLQSTGSQKVGHDWVTELNKLNLLFLWFILSPLL